MFSIPCEPEPTYFRIDPVSKVARDLGTASVAIILITCGDAKILLQFGSYSEELKISGMVIAETILSCVSASCMRDCLWAGCAAEDGNKRKGPEYETLVGFGPNPGKRPIVATRLGSYATAWGWTRSV
jgi:hypothetical protein